MWPFRVCGALTAIRKVMVIGSVIIAATLQTDYPDDDEATAWKVSSNHDHLVKRHSFNRPGIRSIDKSIARSRTRWGYAQCHQCKGSSELE